MANDRLGQSSRAKMIALILAEQRPKALHKILWIGISDGLNCKNALLTVWYASGYTVENQGARAVVGSIS